MKMEREEVLERKVVHKKKKGEWEPHEIIIPATEYYCPACGSVFLWKRLHKLQRIVDPFAEDSVNFIKRMNKHDIHSFDDIFYKLIS